MQFPANPCKRGKEWAYFLPFSCFKAKNDLHGFCMGFAYAFSTCKKRAKRFKY
jgi:hypothetical protein